MPGLQELKGVLIGLLALAGAEEQMLLTASPPAEPGSPSERARIATCDVRVPASVAIAAIASRSSCTVRLGVKSCVTRIAFAPLGRSTGS